MALTHARPSSRNIVVYPTILALVTSAETAPPLARPLAAVGDCADEDRRLRLRRSSTALTTVGACEKWKRGKVQEWEGGGVWIRDWRRRLIALIPLGQLRVINEEEFVQLLLQQELIISDGLGDAEDELWSPNEKKLFPMVEKGAMR